MSYQPENPPLDPEEGLSYVYRELQRIANTFSFATMHNVDFLAAAPKKPREGMVVGADGTNWNPGAGKGVYAYYSGAWNKLG